MHPLTTFPALLTFSLVAPLLLRLGVGILRLFASGEKFKNRKKFLGGFNLLASLSLIIGLYTQIAAIVSIVLIVIDYGREKKLNTLSREKKALTILMMVILLSLLVTGPGFLAFDLPL